MTVVASGLDGKLFDDAVPRFLYAGGGLVYDRVDSKFLSHLSLLNLGLTAEIGLRPAGNNPNFDFPGEGSAAPVGQTVAGLNSVNVTITIVGGPLAAAGGARAQITLNGTGDHVSANVALTAGMTAAQIAAALAPAIDALADLTAVAAGAVITITCGTICSYAAIVGLIPPVTTATTTTDPDPNPDGTHHHHHHHHHDDADDDESQDAKPVGKAKGKGKDKD